MRPSSEILEQLRGMQLDGVVGQVIKTLFAEIDALTAERDVLRDSLTAQNIFNKESCKDRDQWRAYAEKLRETLEECEECHKCKLSREALTLEKPK